MQIHPYTVSYRVKAINLTGVNAFTPFIAENAKDVKGDLAVSLRRFPALGCGNSLSLWRHPIAGAAR